MKRTTDVAILGGGVIGASVAWHLAQRGIRSIVIDRTPFAGSTAKATGGFRAQFATPVNIRLSLLSREKLLRFTDETGVDPGYTPCGYLFLAQTEEQLRTLAEANAVQRSNGVSEARVISEKEAAELNPHVARGTFVGGTFGDRDGFIRPMEILRGYRESAARRGAEFLEGHCVRTQRSGSRITAIETTDDEIVAEHFVNAAGAWAGLVAREQLGMELPVTPLRRCVVPTVVTDRLPHDMPMTIWVGDGFHLRVRDGRVLLLWPDDAPSSFEHSVDGFWIDKVERFTRERVPALEGVDLDRAAAWSGLYELSPDHHAILGRAAEIENLYLANGSSGHGAMHSPAIGQVIAELIAGEKTTIHVHELRPTRFAEGAAIQGSHLL